MHKKTLQNLFSYRKREEVLAGIQSSWKLNDLFISWSEEQKRHFSTSAPGSVVSKSFLTVFSKKFSTQNTLRSGSASFYRSY